MKNNFLYLHKILYIYILCIITIYITSCKSQPQNKTKINSNKSYGTEIGYVMPNFIQKNPNGENISLNDFRGYYLLVDFWASWCNPCREENKNLVNTFNTFKDKNFTILSISLDKERNDWVNAIKKDKLKWEHISDLNFWDNEIAKKFKIDYIPYNFLLNPQGIIIAKNIYNKNLNNKLNYFLNNTK